MIFSKFNIYYKKKVLDIYIRVLFFYSKLNKMIMKQIDLKTWAIIILIGIIGMYSIFSPTTPKPDKGSVTIDGITYSVLSHTTDTVTVPHDSIIYKKGKTIRKDTTIVIEVPAKVDTAKILKAYYAINVYSDSVGLKDSLGWVKVNDSISQNTIKGRNWSYHINSKTVTETTTVKAPPTNQLYIGVNMGFDKVNFINSITPGLIYKTKNDNIYQLGIGMFGINDNGNTVLRPYLMIGKYWKIKIK